MNSKVVSVILTEDGTTQSYFTLQGEPIGILREGVVEPPKPSKPPKKKGGVVGRPTPQEVKDEREAETERTIDKIREGQNS